MPIICMWIFLYLLVSVTSTNITDCWEHVNYDIPYQNGTVIDPCDDGECWSYCDHEKWYNDNFEDYQFTANRLKQEQYDCIETGCTDFYYSNVNLEILEQCVSAKCKIEHDIIEKSRQCSSVLLEASNIYGILYQQKLNYDSVTDFQRTMTEYSKTKFITEINNIVENEKNTIDQLQMASDKIREFLNINDDEEEELMLGSVQTIVNGLNISVQQDVHQLAEHIHDIHSDLYSIHHTLQYGHSIESAIQETKNFIDGRRNQLVRFFVWQNETCAPINILMEYIEQSCSVCTSHGLCQFENNIFSCICDPGWKGDMCEYEQNSCSDNPCINDGTCFEGYSNFRCECTDDWYGPFCQHRINITAGCSNTPCINGGTCTDIQPVGYQCQCPFNFVGKNCQQAVIECEPSPCIHGTCTVSDTQLLSCECDKEHVYNQPFWTGERCNTTQTSCEYIHSSYVSGVLIHGNPCSGHGICELNAEAATWKCTCDSNYIGKRCNIKLDDANPCVLYNIPCIHGNCNTCNNNTDHCTCECDPGWEGEQCSINKNDCEPNPCQHDGTCIDKINDFYCDCSTIKKPWTGRHCEKPADGCLHSPCGTPEQHQTCETDWTSHSGIQCHCNPGWWGNRCEINAAKCNNNLCLNGGNCIQGIYAFCNCPNGWEGDRCETPVEYCNDKPCGSNGECKSTSTGFVCHCFGGWTGDRCNENINECQNITCLHKGKCIDNVNHYKCECKGDWSGTHCEILKTSCDDIHCENNGVCIDTRYEPWTSNDWECACTKGFTGEKCTIDPGTTFSFTMMIGIGVGILIISGPTCLIFWTRFKEKESGRNKRKHKLIAYQEM